MAYSFSQIGTYRSCPRKFQFEKIEKIPTEFTATPATALGNAVHETLEELYRQVSHARTPTRDEILQNYDNARTRELKNIAPERLPGAGDLDAIRERGKNYLHEYHDRHHPFTQEKLRAVEENLSFEIADQISFRGKIDRLDLRDGDIVINDYKTNTRIPADSDDSVRDQITLYALGIKQKRATKIDKIRGRIFYLHFDLIDEREITQQLLDQTQEKYLALIREIEARKKLHAAGDQNAFPTQTGTHCQRCAFREICPARKHENLHDDTAQLDGQQRPIAEIIEKFKKLKDEKKNLETREKFLKEIIVSYATEKWISKIFSDDRKLSLVTKKTPSIIDPDALLQKLKDLDLTDEFLKPDSAALGKAISTGKLDRDDFADLITFKESTYPHSITPRKKQDDDEED